MTPSALLSMLEQVEALVGARRHVIAFSGGRDSTVLLDLARRALPRIPSARLLAAHVDHRWHENSGQWASQCKAQARQLGVRFRMHTVDGTAAAGQSPEAAARSARYRVLAAAMDPGDVLWTGHHAEDQMETVLLQLLRGSGVAGLAAMPRLTRFGRGWHWRPLLETPGQQIDAYARRHALALIDDPANQDARFDRSYLRQRVLPLLQQRWPAAARSVGRSARHCAAAAGLIDEVAARDLSETMDAGNRLDTHRLAALSAPRQAHLLRCWLSAQHLPTPTDAQLQRMLRDLLQSRRDAEPCISYADVEVRRYRDRLYAMPALAPVPDAYRGDLRSGETTVLPAGLGTLTTAATVGAGLAARFLDTGLQLRFRDGGERLQPAGARHLRTLSNLFQERGVVPWMRGRTPFLFRDGQLVAVADLWVAGAFAAVKGEPGVNIVWQGHPPLY